MTARQVRRGRRGRGVQGVQGVHGVHGVGGVEKGRRDKMAGELAARWGAGRGLQGRVGPALGTLAAGRRPRTSVPWRR